MKFNINNEFLPWLLSLGSIVVFLVFRIFLILWIKRLPRDFYKILLRVLRIPTLFWCVIAGIRVSTEFWPHEDKFPAIMNMMIAILAIISITMAMSRVAVAIVSHYLLKIQSPLYKSGIIRGALLATSYLLGFMILLSRLGVHIEALLTALGVGGLAVSLALQDTLSNLFAGIALIVDRSIYLGDDISIDENYAGKVEDIGWRTTKLRTPSNEVLIVPNLKLAQSITVNKPQLKRD